MIHLMTPFLTKNYRFMTFIVLLSGILCGSCKNDDENNDIIWDIAPMYADIIFRNSDGVNLLAPDTPGGLYGKDIWVDYDGEIYPAQWTFPPQSRAYLAVFYGLVYCEGNGINLPDHEKDHMFFGKFDGAEDQDIDFTLHIEGVEETYHFELRNKIKWIKGNPDINRTIKLNGEFQDIRNPIEIIIPNQQS